MVTNPKAFEVSFFVVDGLRPTSTMVRCRSAQQEFKDRQRCRYYAPWAANRKSTGRLHHMLRANICKNDIRNYDWDHIVFLLTIGLFDVHRSLISWESNSGWMTPLINSKNKNSNGTSFQANCWATQRVCQILILMPTLMLIPNTNTNTQKKSFRTFAHWNQRLGSDIGGAIWI